MDESWYFFLHYNIFFPILFLPDDVLTELSLILIFFSENG